MSDRNDGALLAIGGVLTVVILGMWVMKFVEEMFKQLEKTFDAFAGMVTSTLGVLFVLAKMAVLVSIIVGSVVAAVYFTYRYYRMVRKATDLKAHVDRATQKLTLEVSSQVSSLESLVDHRLAVMSKALYDALKEPEVTAIAAKPESPAVEPLPAPEVRDVAETQPEPSLIEGQSEPTDTISTL